MVKKEEKRRVPLNERIDELQEELSTTKYNKATQHAIGLLKAKIARLKEEHVKKSKKGKGEGYSSKKTGDATVILLGYPSVGKSTLLNKLTNAKSEVGYYDFTTLRVVPGLMEYEGAKIQILDIPGIVEGASSGKGRGKEVLACLNNADLIIFLADDKNFKKIDILKKEVHNSNIRINSERPDIRFSRKNKGGLSITILGKGKELNKEFVKDILKEFRIHNADVTIRGKANVDDLIDVIEGNRKYISGLVVLNKVDVISEKKLGKVKSKIDIGISAEKDVNVKELRKLIFEKLNLIRIYCKERGKEADMNEPLIMKKGSSLRDMCEKIHKDFLNKFRFARVWGKSVKFDGQKVLNLNHGLKDKDVIELHL